MTTKAYACTTATMVGKRKAYAEMTETTVLATKACAGTKGTTTTTTAYADRKDTKIATPERHRGAP